jgi:hypothetical protein
LRFAFAILTLTLTPHSHILHSNPQLQPALLFSKTISSMYREVPEYGPAIGRTNSVNSLSSASSTSSLSSLSAPSHATATATAAAASAKKSASVIPRARTPAFVSLKESLLLKQMKASGLPTDSSSTSSSSSIRSRSRSGSSINSTVDALDGKERKEGPFSFPKLSGSLSEGTDTELGERTRAETETVESSKDASRRQSLHAAVVQPLPSPLQNELFFVYDKNR